MICILNILFNHPVSEATPNSEITGAYCAASFQYTNRAQKIHECGNWERGRAVSFLGIHKSDLVCSAPCYEVSSCCTLLPGWQQKYDRYKV